MFTSQILSSLTNNTSLRSIPTFRRNSTITRLRHLIRVITSRSSNTTRFLLRLRRFILGTNTSRKVRNQRQLIRRRSQNLNNGNPHRSRTLLRPTQRITRPPINPINRPRHHGLIIRPHTTFNLNRTNRLRPRTSIFTRHPP